MAGQRGASSEKLQFPRAGSVNWPAGPLGLKRDKQPLPLGCPYLANHPRERERSDRSAQLRDMQTSRGLTALIKKCIDACLLASHEEIAVAGKTHKSFDCVSLYQPYLTFVNAAPLFLHLPILLYLWLGLKL